MKTLIIHPQDSSTIFLKRIYLNLPDKTVITGGIKKAEVLEYIQCHDRVICCGHGSPSGLFSVGEFPDSYPYIVDDSVVRYLKNQHNNLYVWCHASEFVKRNRLHGLFNQMMISEIQEALWYNFPYTDSLEDWINESNNVFSSTIGKYLNQPLDILFNNLISQYGELAKTNPIADFNSKRIYLKVPNTKFVIQK